MTQYSITFRDLLNDLTGIIIDVTRDGVLVSRTYAAAVQRSAIMPTLNEIRRLMATKAITEAR